VRYICSATFVACKSFFDERLKKLPSLSAAAIEPFRAKQVVGSKQGGFPMPESNCPLVERIARVLAGAELSANADGTDAHAGREVDEHWRDHLNKAQAVLHTMREPDEAMAAVGDVETWRNMVEAAITQKVD
jgi:hypothetical protein